MTDRHRSECALIRQIAAVECTREADRLGSLTHTPIEKASPGSLSDTQCVLLYAIHLDGQQKSEPPDGYIVSHGVPRHSVNPCEPVYDPADVEQAETLQREISELSRCRNTEDWENRITAIYDELDQLNTAEPIAVSAMSVWANPSTLDISSDEDIHHRAMEHLAGLVETAIEVQEEPNEVSFRAVVSEYKANQWQGGDENIRKTMGKVQAGKQHGWVFGSGNDKAGFANGQRETQPDFDSLALRTSDRHNA